MGLTRFIQYTLYLGLTGFCIGLHALIIVSGPDQSNELSMFDGDDGIISPDSLQDIWRVDCTIRAFDTQVIK